MSGFDLDLIDKIRPYLNIPITVLGGAGEEDHFKKLI